MTHTQLLNHIRQELKRQGVLWKKEQEIFELLLPDENWKKYRSTWYSWKPDKEGFYNIEYMSKSSHILTKISQKLFLDFSVWEASTLEQKRAVEQGVREYVRQKDVLDISSMIPQYTLSEEQEGLLKKIERLWVEKIDEKLCEHETCFKKTFANQAFLLKLLNILYLRGAYELLVEKVFPNLMAHQRSNTKVKILEAHTLGSLKKPRCMEAVKLLESIESSQTNEIIDLKTAAISNLRRHHRANSDFSNEALKEGIVRMVETYYQIYAFKGNHHYYPAINLMYALVLAEVLGLETIEVDKERVFKEATKSIKKEKKSESSDDVYYAWVSELEFFLLLGKSDVMQKMEMLLADLEPSFSLVERTQRQMLEFVNMAERLGADLGEIGLEFQKVVGLLGDYGREGK